MAHLYLLEIGAVALCLIIYSIVSYYVRERRFNTFAIANGCQLPQNASPANYLLAVREAWIQLFRIIDMASKGEDFLDGIFGAQVITGSTMHRIQFDGRQVVMTNEPANLQAVLATQFKVGSCLRKTSFLGQYTILMDGNCRTLRSESSVSLSSTRSLGHRSFPVTEGKLSGHVWEEVAARQLTGSSWQCVGALSCALSPAI